MTHPLPLALILLGVASLAWGAQPGFYSTPPSLTNYATQAQIQELQGSMPQPCTTVPSPDTLLGSLGTGTPCTLRQDTARPTVVQAANVVTDASGNWSVTWAKAFASPTPAVNPLPVNTGTLPIMCNVQARTASGASGKCWQANTNTLPGTIASLAGLVVNVFASGAANASVMVIARETTQ